MNSITTTILSFLIFKIILAQTNSSHLYPRQNVRGASYIQQIGVGLVAPIHIVQSPRTGKIIFLERVNGGAAGTTHSQEFDLQSGFSRPLNLPSDTFCSAGFISPDPLGRVFNVGGWDGPALEAVRHLTPCGLPGQFGQCDWIENAQVAALKVPRWYPSALPLPSGRVVIIGGTTSATGLQPPALNQPSVEFLPPLVGEQVITLQLLVETDTYNLYPIAHLLPNGLVFILAGDRSQLFNPDTFVPLVELPPIVGTRTYPTAGSSVMLALRPSNNYLAEILVCGGGSGYTKQSPALDTCGRITPSAITPQWQMEQMPVARLMPDMTLLPDGTVFIANGAAMGWGGFDNAQMPVYTSLIYHPEYPVGNRFTIEATSPIARMYHSETLLLEDGRVLITGSTPNANADAVDVEFPNEKRIEVFVPGYLTSGLARPTYTMTNIDWVYGQAINLVAKIPSLNAKTVKAVLFTNGFVTHSTHQGQRLVELVVGVTPQGGNQFVVTVVSPPTAQILPPGWYMLFLLDGPTPSVASWVRVGGDPAGIANWV